METNTYDENTIIALFLTMIVPLAMVFAGVLSVIERKIERKMEIASMPHFDYLDDLEKYLKENDGLKSFMLRDRYGLKSLRIVGGRKAIETGASIVPQSSHIST